MNSLTLAKVGGDRARHCSRVTITDCFDHTSMTVDLTRSETVDVVKDLLRQLGASDIASDLDFLREE